MKRAVQSNLQERPQQKTSSGRHTMNLTLGGKQNVHFSPFNQAGNTPGESINILDEPYHSTSVGPPAKSIQRGKLPPKSPTRAPNGFLQFHSRIPRKIPAAGELVIKERGSPQIKMSNARAPNRGMFKGLASKDLNQMRKKPYQSMSCLAKFKFGVSRNIARDIPQISKTYEDSLKAYMTTAVLSYITSAPFKSDLGRCIMSEIYTRVTEVASQAHAQHGMRPAEAKNKRQNISVAQQLSNKSVNQSRVQSKASAISLQDNHSNHFGISDCVASLIGYIMRKHKRQIIAKFKRESPKPLTTSKTAMEMMDNVFKSILASIMNADSQKPEDISDEDFPASMNNIHTVNSSGRQSPFKNRNDDILGSSGSKSPFDETLTSHAENSYSNFDTMIPEAGNTVSEPANEFAPGLLESLPGGIDLRPIIKPMETLDLESGFDGAAVEQHLSESDTISQCSSLCLNVGTPKGSKMSAFSTTLSSDTDQDSFGVSSKTLRQESRTTEQYLSSELEVTDEDESTLPAFISPSQASALEQDQLLTIPASPSSEVPDFPKGSARRRTRPTKRSTSSHSLNSDSSVNTRRLDESLTSLHDQEQGSFGGSTSLHEKSRALDRSQSSEHEGKEEDEDEGQNKSGLARFISPPMSCSEKFVRRDSESSRCTSSLDASLISYLIAEATEQFLTSDQDEDSSRGSSELLHLENGPIDHYMSSEPEVKGEEEDEEEDERTLSAFFPLSQTSTLEEKQPLGTPSAPSSELLDLSCNSSRNTIGANPSLTSSILDGAEFTLSDQEQDSFECSFESRHQDSRVRDRYQTSESVLEGDDEDEGEDEDESSFQFTIS